MNATKKQLIWEKDKHEALKVLIKLSDPEIWIEHGIYTIEQDVNVSHRTAKKLFKYWVKRWGFKTNSKWDSGIRGLWAMRPMFRSPLLSMKDFKSEIIVAESGYRFEFPLPLTKF